MCHKLHGSASSPPQQIKAFTALVMDFPKSIISDVLLPLSGSQSCLYLVREPRGSF